MEKDRAIQGALRYHTETKHHLDRYARSAGVMDWQNQPDPFRRYADTELIPLPLLGDDPDAGYENLYHHKARKSSAIDKTTVGGFLELSLGLSAWKSIGHERWSLRMNPSSGNLHPTEAHLILPDMTGIPGGVYHYNVLEHALESRATLSMTLTERVKAHLDSPGFGFGLTSIFWREAWKYGERAYRYCNLDVGHALAAAIFSANLFGWEITCLAGLSDAETETLLGLDRVDWPPNEKEHPDILSWIHPAGADIRPRSLPKDIVADFSLQPFNGQPNRLSHSTVCWEIIYKTAEILEKPATGYVPRPLRSRTFPNQPTLDLPAARIIRKRRSAMAFRSDAQLRKDQFFSMLDKTLPRIGNTPFDLISHETAVNLFIFVHQVIGLEPGLYFLERTSGDLGSLQRLCQANFLWTPSHKDLPLYLLRRGDLRTEAITLSCHQEIAGLSAFSLGMVARFKATISRAAYRYRQLFWECGMIGQVLYLEAEAHGVRGTGIGCFFDDEVHRLFGLKTDAYQSLYHFTVGVPVSDKRLETHPPYFHLARNDSRKADSGESIP
jgi:SagB-type dehydrogenase family enzyme